MNIEIYVKPECKNNKKQIALLKAQGHTVVVNNIFDENWTKEKLLTFFQDTPIEQCYNLYAPRIKSGEIDPSKFSKDELLAEMIADNYLIRRPLIKAGDNFVCGFDNELAKTLTGKSELSKVVQCHQTGAKCD